jgi:serine/threonine-protein kinase
MARFLTFRELDPTSWLVQAKADANEAIRRDPSEVEVYAAQASVLRTEGYRMLSRGQDPSARLMEAISAADSGLRLEPGHIVLLNIRSSALLAWIDTSRMRGTYARAAVEPYLREARALADVHVEDSYFQAHLGGIAQALARAEMANGGDPALDAEEAARAYEAALKSQPAHVGYHRGIQIARAVQARNMANKRQDPKVIVDQARAAFQRAQQAHASTSTITPFFMDTLTSAASYALEKGLDPSAYIEEVEQLPLSLDQNSDDPVQFGTLRLRYLTFTLRTERPSQRTNSRVIGEAIANDLVRLKPVDPEFWMTLADFREASGAPTAARQARGRGRALNPRWRAF